MEPKDLIKVWNKIINQYKETIKETPSIDLKRMLNERIEAIGNCIDDLETVLRDNK